MPMTNAGLIAVVKSFHDLLVPSKDKDYSWRKYSKQLKGLKIGNSYRAKLTFGHRQIDLVLHGSAKGEMIHFKHSLDNGFSNDVPTSAAVAAWKDEFSQALSDLYNKQVTPDLLIRKIVDEAFNTLRDDKTASIMIYEGMVSVNGGGTAYSVYPTLNLS